MSLRDGALPSKQSPVASGDCFGQRTRAPSQRHETHRDRARHCPRQLGIDPLAAREEKVKKVIERVWEG